MRIVLYISQKIILILYLEDIDASGEEVWVTSGGGFERSILLLLFQKYFEKRFEELCTPLIDCYYTLSTVPMSSTTPISETKRRDLGLFGATVALALVNGYLPEKLNPLLLVYFLSDCQFECLNRTAVMDLFPELGATIDDWLSTPHDDDSNLNRFQAHFATYHNMEVRSHIHCYVLISFMKCRTDLRSDQSY